MKKNSYKGIVFIMLVFGSWAVPKIIQKLKKKDNLMTFEKVPHFEFTNQNGKIISNNFYKGKVYVVEFFFTTCPTICPKMNTSLLKIQQTYLGNPNFGIASITINPKHDTPEVLKKYEIEKSITSKNWNLLTGDKDSIYALANHGFKLYAGEDSTATGGFKHSGLFALIDKKGYIRSRVVKKGGFENPLKYYDGLDPKQVHMLKEDIDILLNE